MSLRFPLFVSSVLLPLALGLGACSSTPPLEVSDAAANAPGAASTHGLEEVEIGGARPWEDPANPLHERLIYFDYDSAQIQPQYLGLLRTHAAFLGARPGQRVILEGHTDERGAREYNLALGDQRAEVVRRFLLAEGVRPEQLATLSYGEERPAVFGHDESAWSRNRRVVIQY